jgi:hypothetical protein
MRYFVQSFYSILLPVIHSISLFGFKFAEIFEFEISPRSDIQQKIFIGITDPMENYSEGSDTSWQLVKRDLIHCRNSFRGV